MIARALERLTAATRWLLAAAFVLAVALNFANVIGRYAFGRSMLGADEVQIYIMVAMTFLGAAVVSWQDGHLRMNVIARALPGGLQAVLHAAEVVLVVALAGFVAVLSSHYAVQMLKLDRMSDNAGIPLWIPHGSIALGFGLIALVSAWRGFEEFRARGAKGEGGCSEDRGA
jgi:TRAP-type C4-dicarboxylate transport system permease small subunit